MRRFSIHKHLLMLMMILTAVSVNACTSNETADRSPAEEPAKVPETVQAPEPVGQDDVKEHDPGTSEDDGEVSKMAEESSGNDEPVSGGNESVGEDKDIPADPGAQDTSEDDAGILAEQKEAENVTDKDAYVNERIDVLINSPEYKSASLEERSDVARALLQDLEGDGYIREYSIDSLGSLYTFVYDSGRNGGIYLKDFSGKPGGPAIN